jgi:hypothetical protein
MLSVAPAQSALRRFSHSMPRGSNCGRSGDAAGEAYFPFSACGRVACICVAIASSRHGCPASAFWLVPARSSLDRGMSLFDGELCPCGFRTLKRFVGLPALASVGWPGPGSCAFSREWRLSREHVAGLARDTHLWFLFEARRTYGLSTAGAIDRACEQFSGPLPICGSCALGASSPGVPLPVI